MDSCEEDDDILLNLEIDSDEEEQVGEKCISLLASLLPSNSSPTLTNLISNALSLEFEKATDDQQKASSSSSFEMDEEEDDTQISISIMDTYDFPDPYPVQIRARPQVPPKPPIDTVRYSMNNIKESTNWQLDELLEELEALEVQLNTTNGGDQLVLGVSGMPSSSSRDKLPPPPPQVSAPNHIVQMNHAQPTFQQNIHHQVMPSSCSSPDGDSAFCDSSSTESSNRCRNSAFSSNESCRDSLNTPSPTQVSPRNGELTAEEAKALKIKQALEKMKEAKVTRIFVKFFVEDGQPLQMLIDERWTVADTMKQLAEKNQIALMEDHCIVEEFPELYIKRIYEDHEKVVENIQMWVQDSPNKLYFMRRSDKYAFTDRPERYLVTSKTSDHMEIPQGDWTMEVKQKFINDYFNRDTVVPPEMEGFLYLKSDGRKSWKKHFFVLRPSGLYYSSKGKKSSTTKDLTCLMNMHSNQVYTGINWEKKYKSPTPYCISLKLTALQIKRSQYIKYICAEDEMTFKKWLVALRIAKNGKYLFQNFERACQIRRDTLGGAGMSAASSSVAISEHQGNGLQQHSRAPSAASTVQFGHPTHFANSMLSVNVRTQSPALSSVISSQPSQPSPSRQVLEKPMELTQQYVEQLTGTIKRAPIDAVRRISRTSTSSAPSPTIPQEESDSDEEFPAPPPPAAVRILNQPPATPPKPIGTPMSSKKIAPPPPPKRSEATKLHSASNLSQTFGNNNSPQKHMTDLEAALARRREKMGAMEG